MLESGKNRESLKQTVNKKLERSCDEVLSIFADDLHEGIISYLRAALTGSDDPLIRLRQLRGACKEGGVLPAVVENIILSFSASLSDSERETILSHDSTIFDKIL